MRPNARIKIVCGLPSQLNGSRLVPRAFVAPSIRMPSTENVTPVVLRVT